MVIAAALVVVLVARGVSRNRKAKEEAASAASAASPATVQVIREPLTREASVAAHWGTPSIRRATDDDVDLHISRHNSWVGGLSDIAFLPPPPLSHGASSSTGPSTSAAGGASRAALQPPSRFKKDSMRLTDSALGQEREEEIEPGFMTGRSLRAASHASRRGSLAGAPSMELERRPSLLGTRIGIEPSSSTFLTFPPNLLGNEKPPSPRETAGLTLPDDSDDDEYIAPKEGDVWAQARSAPVSAMEKDEWKDEAPVVKTESSRAKSMTGLPSGLPGPSHGPSYSGLHAEKSLRAVSPKTTTVPDKLGHFAQPKRSAVSMSGPAPNLKTPSSRKGVGSEKRKSILGPAAGDNH